MPKRLQTNSKFFENEAMIIDTHTHIFDNQAYDEYRAKRGREKVKALVIYQWFISLARNGEGKFIEYALSDFLSFIESKEDLYTIGAIDMERDVKPQIAEYEVLLKERRVLGIKIYPGYQHIYPSDKRLYPVANLCEDYNVPLLFHSGDVYDTEGEGTAILKYSHPIHVDGLAVKFPKCKIIIAHFGFPYQLETANVVSKNRNVYTEISGTLDARDTSAAMRTAISQYAKDLERVYAYFPDVRKKTMFGTDYSGEATPLNQFHAYVKLVETVFAKSERARVFYDLAQSLFFSRPI